MVGPVLYQELVRSSRGSRQHVFRWVYGGWLVLQVFLFYGLYVLDYRRPAGSLATAVVASQFVPVFVVQQLILMVLAVPAFAAGAVTEEKARGTLPHLLTTALEARHIVVGKLLGRTAQAATVLLAGLPLFCFLGAIAGLAPITLLAVVVVTVLPLGALGAATLLASVWSLQTRDALLGLYAAGAGGFLAVVLLGGPLEYFNPLYVLEPAWSDVPQEHLPELARRLAWSAAAWGLLGAVCLGLAVWRLRPAFRKQMEASGRRKETRCWQVPRLAVAEEPIPWREQHVEGLAPIKALRGIPRWLGLAAVAALAALSSLGILWLNLAPRRTLWDVLRAALHFDFPYLAGLISPGVSDGFLFQALVVLFLASLVVGIRCSGAVSGEREAQTWEALLLTPLSGRQLIRGKLWGIWAAGGVYLLAYALPAVMLAAVAGPIALFWALLWLAVTLLAMYFLGAAGLFCSVRARSSRRSLLWTLGIGYVGGFLVYLFTTPVVGAAALVMLVFLSAVEDFLQGYLQVSFMPTILGRLGLYYVAFLIASGLALAAVYWALARSFLASAQKWVAERERTRAWRDGPAYRRPMPRTGA